MSYFRIVKNVYNEEIISLSNSLSNLDERKFNNLIDIIINTKGRLVLTGMGKAGHIAKKISATISSLGTASFFIHPSEALHGDLGSLKNEDTVLIFSKSGETEEVLNLIPSLNKIGAKIVSITCQTDSTLEKNSDLSLTLDVLNEASFNNLAPTSSTTAMLVFGDALAVTLEKATGFTEEKFAINHPNGTIGKGLLLTVKDLLDSNPKVFENQTLKDAIMIMSSSKYGAVNIVDKDNKLLGLLTDGDLRRIIFNSNQSGLLDSTVSEYMTTNPISINVAAKAIEALKLMQERKNPLTVLPVVNNQGVSVGLININDILSVGLKNE